MNTTLRVGTQRGELCTACGIPLDSRPFDAFGAVRTADLHVGQRVVLASFTLPQHYCGTLQCFSQYTDLLATSQGYGTAGLVWSLLTNGRPLAPYQRMTLVVNPWGIGGFPIELRLDEGATVQFVVQRTAEPLQPRLTEIGGRISGRYWYNHLYGGTDSRVAGRATG
jgi:hypothetical protein